MLYQRLEKGLSRESKNRGFTYFDGYCNMQKSSAGLAICYPTSIFSLVPTYSTDRPTCNSQGVEWGVLYSWGKVNEKNANGTYTVRQ